jgi:hypothetical protein
VLLIEIFYKNFNFFVYLLTVNQNVDGANKNVAQGGQQGGVVANFKGYFYDLVRGRYIISDPNNTAAPGFNSPALNNLMLLIWLTFFSIFGTIIMLILLLFVT